jgi:hypothetical protein
MRTFNCTSLVWLITLATLLSLISPAYAQETRSNPEAPEGQLPLRHGEEDGSMLTEVSGGYASEKLASRITLVMHNRSLRDILMKVAELSGVILVFNDDLVAISDVSVAAQRKPVQHVLDELLLGRGINYVVSARGHVIIGNEQRVSESVGTVRGTVQEKGGEPLVGAHIVVRGTRLGATADGQGRFVIGRLQPGLYTLETTCMGFGKVVRQVMVRAGETVNVDFLLDETAFLIGGIEVVGTSEVLPREAQSRTVINSAEIEHFQASSIGDVLDLVPGVQKTDNPGLGKTSQIAVRGEESDKLSAFGTLVMVDGIPMSNNANLQFERYTKSATGVSNLGGGADLRLIPADNVATIEVVTGMPSVRYGDMTSGLINVQTKVGSQPHRLKIKNNPDTREANLGGGFEMGESGLSYNVNAAQSERDIRKDGDEYLRLTGQVVHSTTFLDDALTLNAKIHGQKIFDEEEPKGDVQKIRNYNRGHTLGFATWGKYAFTAGISDLDFNTYLTYRKEDSHRSKLVQSDLRVLPSGDTVSTYMGQVETRGNEWTLGGRLEWNNAFFTGDFIHKMLIGTDLQYNANTGEGVILDTLFNYYGSSSGRIPYSFDSIPGQLLASIYAEDRISGRLGVDFTLSFGVRYEMYRPFGLDFGGLFGEGDFVKSHQGSFLKPRFSLLLALSDQNQLRISAGSSSKSPPMSAIFPPPDVIRWRNPVAQTVQYFRPDAWVPDLRGYREKQVELSFDQKLFRSAGVTLTGYYRERNQEPESRSFPIFASASSGGKTIVYYVDYYSLYRNDGWTQSKGVEFSIRTGTIRPLNMDFRVVGAYSFTKAGNTMRTYSATPNASFGQYPNYQVPGMGADTLIGWWYPSGGYWRDRLILNYYLRYTVAPLGLWVTLRAEQLVWERYQYVNRVPVDYALLTPADAAQRAFDESEQTKYVKWLLNVNVSKSLFKGAEISFYVNNFLDDPAITRYMSSATVATETTRNPPLFYGIEFSMVVDELFGKGE